METYSSSLLQQIRKITFNNFSISHLNNNIRSRIISLGIHKQYIPRPYRCSRAGNNLFHKILIICSNTSGIKPFHQQLGPNQLNLITPIITRNQSVSATLSHINVQSIVNKTSSFQEYITDLSPTICALAETWLSNDEADLRFKDVPPKGYSIISRP